MIDFVYIIRSHVDDTVGELVEECVYVRRSVT